VNKTVLVVDDSATVRQQVTLCLSAAGYNVLEAVDGSDGVEQISKRQDLAMVICDVNMPRMSGLELLEAVKAAGKHVGLPIVMLTTEAQSSMIDRAKRAGAKGWILKPFTPAMLVAAVKKIAGA